MIRISYKQRYILVRNQTLKQDRWFILWEDR